MTSTLRNATIKCLVAFAAIGLFPYFAFAQEGLSLSVSPTLFELTAVPGQTLNSEIRVINSNPFPLTIYTNAVNFEARGESGQGRFLPVFEDLTDGTTFAEWITPGFDEFTIPAEQTVQVPFRIAVPPDAPPGGHYAALLVGTRPTTNEEGSLRVETSQVVSSLLFLRVSGEILEQGSIREFRTTQLIHEQPEVAFELRFQNRGNVHLQPQGEIKIYNMWGHERGVIPVNRRSLFGNVLPDSVRRYSFTWTGDWSLSDMGRYRAEATLAFGESQRQFSSGETYFWVVPWRALLLVLSGLIGFFLLMSWGIKLYVRRMLKLAGISPEIQQINKGRQINQVSVTAPLEHGMLDLRTRLQQSTGPFGKAGQFLSFILSYRIFFLLLIVFGLFVIMLSWYLRDAATPSRNYQVTIDGVGNGVTLSSDDVRYDELTDEPGVNVNQANKEFPAIAVVNRSGITGLAADVRITLETAGYPVTDLDTDIGVSEQQSVLVYDPAVSEEALELSQFLDGVLLSAYADPSPNEEVPITLYIGTDLEGMIE